MILTLQWINSNHPISTPFGIFSMCFLVNKQNASLDINYPFPNVQSACFFPLSILRIIITYTLSNISKLPPIMILRQRIFCFSFFRKQLKMNLIINIFQATFCSRTHGTYKITQYKRVKWLTL